MIAFLTSSPGGSKKVDGKRYATSLNISNEFVSKLKEHWRDNSNLLIISAAPDEIEINDSIKNNFEQSFPMSGLSIDNIDLCDARNPLIVQNIKQYDVVILAGGHVPTQNAFFKRIELQKWISFFDGILIGISAGTMNCAKTVYAQPELDGESEDQSYQRFPSGLGITKHMILPHYQDIKDDILDGKRLMEDITYSDSMGKEFIALVDGSYLVIENETTILYGEGYRIKDGDIRQICEQDKHLSLN